MEREKRDAVEAKFARRPFVDCISSACRVHMAISTARITKIIHHAEIQRATLITLGIILLCSSIVSIHISNSRPKLKLASPVSVAILETPDRTRYTSTRRLVANRATVPPYPVWLYPSVRCCRNVRSTSATPFHQQSGGEIKKKLRNNGVIIKNISFAAGSSQPASQPSCSRVSTSS